MESFDWYIFSLVFSTVSYVSSFIVIFRFMMKNENKNKAEIFDDFVSLEILFLLIVPGINILVGFLYITLIIGIINSHKELKRKELDVMNEFYKTECCDVLIRIHHLYRYNETTKRSEIKKCIACEESITYGSLSKSFDDLNEYNSNIPYQTKLSKKEFQNFDKSIKKDKMNSLFDSEEEKYIQLKLKKLNKVKNKKEHLN